MLRAAVQRPPERDQRRGDPRVRPAEHRTSLVAVPRTKAEHATLAVTIDRASGRLLTAPAELRVADHDAELWVIPAGSQPLALDVMEATLRTIAPGNAVQAH